jgi:hypothetical protein
MERISKVRLRNRKGGQMPTLFDFLLFPFIQILFLIRIKGNFKNKKEKVFLLEH